MIKVSEFKPCESNPPTKDGQYLVIRMYDGEVSYASSISYDVGHGWNLLKFSDGTFNTSNQLFYDDGYVWAEVTEE